MESEGFHRTEDINGEQAKLGDNVNVAARLASKAGAGEVLISEAAYQAAGLDLGFMETRTLELKGKSEPVRVHVWQAAQPFVPPDAANAAR